MHGFFDDVFAGFKNGLAGCPAFPYSMMLAIIALDFPSLLGSAKPTLILALPSLPTSTFDRPNDEASSPVDSPLSTPSRLDLTLSKTTSPPTLRTSSVIESILFPSLDNFFKRSSGILQIHLAIG